MIPGSFSWFFMVPGRFSRFSWFQVGFHGFHGSRLVFMVSGWFLCFFSSRFQVGLSLFQVGFFVLVIHGSSLVVHGFLSFFSRFQVSFHGFLRYQVDFSLIVPGWFKSELSAGGAK